jgi:hypothetical protein
MWRSWECAFILRPDTMVANMSNLQLVPRALGKISWHLTSLQIVSETLRRITWHDLSAKLFHELKKEYLDIWPLFYCAVHWEAHLSYLDILTFDLTADCFRNSEKNILTFDLSAMIGQPVDEKACTVLYNINIF